MIPLHAFSSSIRWHLVCAFCAGVFIFCAGSSISSLTWGQTPAVDQSILQIPKKYRADAVDLYTLERNRTVRWVALAKYNGRERVPASFFASDGSFHEMAYYNGLLPIYRKSLNLEASGLIGATKLRGELDILGQNMLIGVWDTGYPYKHAEFGNRLEAGPEESDRQVSGHATHVVGTLIASGLDLQATGIAPGASVRSYDWHFDYLEMYAEAQKGLRISNHSYDFEVGWEPIRRGNQERWTYWTRSHKHGEYIPWSYFWDSVMETYPYYLAVKAAGNEQSHGPESSPTGHYHNDDLSFLRWDRHPVDCLSTYGCLGPAASVKNGLVVGAIDLDGSTLAPFSSTGPTLDGRVKPDIVAPGIDIYSTLSASSYGLSSGTSMATATVTGGLALLLEQERSLFGEKPFLWGSTLKALLIHSSVDLGQAGPDYHFGYGRVYLPGALEIMRSQSKTGDSIHQINLTLETEKTFYPVSDSIKITLVWTDPAGTHPNTILDKQQPLLVHDLDLTMEHNGQTYFPYVLDPQSPEKPAGRGINVRDNVEQIELVSQNTSPIVVRITRSPSRKETDDQPQPVSLIVTGASMQVPIAIEHDMQDQNMTFFNAYPNPIRRGQTLYLKAANTHGVSSLIENNMEIAIYDITGRILAQQNVYFNEIDSFGFRIPHNWNSGVYFIRISELNGIQMQAITVM